MSINAKDTRTQSTTNFSLGKATGSNARKQTIQVIDLISEGPIEGLVNGSASVYLNNDSITPTTATPVSNNTVTLNQGAEVVTSIVECTVTNGSKNIELVPAIGDEEGLLRKIQVKSVYSSGVIQTPDELNPDPNTAYLTLNDYTTFPSWITEQAGETTARLIPTGNSLILVPSEGVEGYISDITNGVATFIPKSPNTRLFGTSGTYVLEVDWRGVVDTTVTPNQLKEAWPRDSGTYDVMLSSPYIDRSVYGALSNSQLSSFNLITNPNSSVEFRTGTLYQKPVNTLGGFNSTSISNPSFQAPALEFIDAKSESVGDPAAPALITASSPTGFGLTAEQISLTDSVRLTFGYSSLVSTNKENGNTIPAAALHKIEVLYTRDGKEYTVVVANPRKHVNGQNNKPSSTPVAFEELINLEPLKPFTDFKIRVTRLTRHDGTGIATDGTDKGNKFTMSALANISRVVAVIKERFNYPLTSLAAVTYSSKDFPNTPIRTYHARGLKVKVPSNYTTREQMGLNTNENDSSNPWHPDNLYEGFWDGSLSTSTVYTNNPAWIFYDVVTNNRYGLGDWLSDQDIDKYMLYRIARYCDELVPDGKGGFEPRFTANLYLTKAADAYKVLKDITTIFRGIIYWMDQKVMVVNESPSEPVYTFAASNVIDGAFNYESTGSKTRVNQVIVSWNNPESNYALEPLLLQDVENIALTGRIVTQDAVAFGCTSEGQAYRYGQWKLWTAKNQTEIVSFKASLDGAFLMPGDVIRIQDQAEYNIAYSGRIASATTTSVTLDREVVLNEGSTYQLSAVFTDTSEENGSDNAPKYTRVEEVDVLSTNGQYSSLSCSAFSQAPDANTIFVLKETVSGTGKVSDASYKEYAIVSISEEANLLYSITAVEYYDSKFSAVDENFNLNVEERGFPTLNELTDVFPPKNVYIIPSPDPSLAGNEFSVQWEKPIEISGSISDNVSGFQIHHEIPGYESPIFTGSDVYSYKFEGVSDGLYKVSVRTVDSLSKKSKAKVAEIRLVDNFSVRTQRAQEGLAIGGVVGSNLEIDGNSFGFTYTNPGLIASGNPAVIYKDSITNLDTTSIPEGTYYTYFQYATGTLKALSYFSDTTKRVDFWVDAATGVAQTTDKIGTVSVEERSNKVVGLNTDFTADYYDGATIFFGSTKAAKVLRVVSESVMFIDRSFEAAITGSTHSRNSLEIDFLRDTIIAEVTKTSESITFNSFMSIDATIKPQSTRTVTIFRKNSQVISNSAGTFESPLQGNTEWSLSIPALENNGDIVYSSTRTFTSDTLGQDATWSAPTISAQRVDGDSITVTGTTTDSETNITTITFSDLSTVEIQNGVDGNTEGVLVIYSSVANPTDNTTLSLTAGSNKYIHYYEYTNSFTDTDSDGIPDDAHEQTFVQFVGESPDPQGVIPIYSSVADPTQDSQLSLTAGTNEYVTFYEWEGTKPTSVPEGSHSETFVKYIGSSITVTSSTTDSETNITTITFSDLSTVEIQNGVDGDTKGVVVIYSSVANPTDNTTLSLTAGSNKYVHYYEYTNSFTDTDSDGIPDDAHEKTFVQFIGESPDPQGVIAIYSSVADPTEDSQLSLTQGTNDYITFYEWSGTKPTSVPEDSHTETFVRFTGSEGPQGPSGFLYYESGDTTLDSAHITLTNPTVGQVAIVTNTAGDQKGYVRETNSWAEKKIVNSGIIFADAIGAGQLEISANQEEADSIFFDGTNNSIKIFSDDGNGTAVLRVRLGNLSDT